MHESVVCLSVSKSVCLFVTRQRSAKTAEQIEVLVKVETLGGPINTVSDGENGKEEM